MGSKLLTQPQTSESKEAVPQGSIMQEVEDIYEEVAPLRCETAGDEAREEETGPVIHEPDPEGGPIAEKER